MKAKSFVKTLCAAAVLLTSSLTLSAENDSNLYYNSEEENGLKVAETIYKANGDLLSNYMKYNYTYDEQKRLVMSEALVWNSRDNRWQKDLCMRYAYEDGYTTTTYYRWSEGRGEYVLLPDMTVTFAEEAR